MVDQVKLANEVAEATDVEFDYKGWNRKSWPRGRDAYARFFEALNDSHLTAVKITADRLVVFMRKGKIEQVGRIGSAPSLYPDNVHMNGRPAAPKR